MKLPRVTIVIANYNYAEYVDKAIQSAVHQEYDGPLSVCIVDDGSTDASWDTIQRYFKDVSPPISLTVNGNDISLVKTEIDGVKLVAILRKNGGASAARNTAIDCMWNDTDVYAILDSDDEYYKNKVDKCARKMIEHFDNIGAVYADYDIQDVNRNITFREFKEPYNGSKLKQRCIVHSGALINKKALEATKDDGGYYDTRLHGPGSQNFIGCSEDYDLWIRIAEKFMIIHIPTVLGLSRETGKNQTSKVTSQTEEKMRSIILEKTVSRQNSV